MYTYFAGLPKAISSSFSTKLWEKGTKRGGEDRQREEGGSKGGKEEEGREKHGIKPRGSQGGRRKEDKERGMKGMG